MVPNEISVKVIWLYALIILTTLIVTGSEGNIIQPTNREILNAIIKFEVTLELKLTNLIEDKFTAVNEKLSQMEQGCKKINDIEVILEAIQRNMTKISGLGETLTNIQQNKTGSNHIDDAVKENIETIKSDVQKIGLKISLRDNDDFGRKPLQQNTFDELKDLKQNISKEMKTLKINVSSIADNLSSLGDHVSDVKIFQANTSELLKNIKKDTESINDPQIAPQSKMNCIEDSIIPTLNEIKENTNSIVLPVNEIKTRIDIVKRNTDTLNSHSNAIKTNTDLIKSKVIEMSYDVDTVDQIVGAVHKIVDRCPHSDGFIVAPGTGGAQCLKPFFSTDLGSSFTWTAARDKCRANGLVLARPYNARALRLFLFEKYSLWSYWVDGRGDGSEVKWQQARPEAREEVRTDSPLWYPGHPGTRVTTDYCLVLLARPDWIKSNPDAPYYSDKCSGTGHVLCEKLI